MTDSPIPEDDLHAYVDGQLPPERHAEVARQLQEQPEAAERVAAYAAQRDGPAGGVRARSPPNRCRRGSPAKPDRRAPGRAPHRLARRRRRAAGLSARGRRRLGAARPVRQPAERSDPAGAGGDRQPRGLRRRPPAPDRTGRRATRRPRPLGVQPPGPPGCAARHVRDRVPLHGRPARGDAAGARRAVHVPERRRARG